MPIGKKIQRAKAKQRRQFFSYEIEWGGSEDNSPRLAFIHYTDLDTNKQRTYIFEFGKPTITTIYRLLNEFVGILNAEIDYGSFVVRSKDAPSAGPNASKHKQREERKQQRAEAREAKEAAKPKGSLIGKNDRTRMLDEYRNINLPDI